MQVFVPYSDPKEVAKVLDISRLNKQVLEANYIIECIRRFEETGDEKNLRHPVMKMYKNDLEWLIYYRDVLDSFRLNKSDSCWDSLKQPRKLPNFIFFKPLLDCHKKRLYQKGKRDMQRRPKTLKENPYSMFSEFDSPNEENLYIIDTEVYSYLNGKLLYKYPAPILKSRLISDLIFARNGDSDDLIIADRIYKEILSTKDSSLIETANNILLII